MSISKALYNFFYPSQSYDSLHKKNDDAAREKLNLQLKQLQKHDQLHSLKDKEIEELSCRIVKEFVKLPLETIDATDLDKMNDEIKRLSKGCDRFRKKTMEELCYAKPKNNALKEQIIMRLVDMLLFLWSEKH